MTLPRGLLVVLGIITLATQHHLCVSPVDARRFRLQDTRRLRDANTTLIRERAKNWGKALRVDAEALSSADNAAAAEEEEGSGSGGGVSQDVLENIGASSADQTHVICRVRASGTGTGEASVLLDARTNARTLMFGTGKVDTGGETTVVCEGKLSDADLAECLKTEDKEVDDAASCGECPCAYNRFSEFPFRFAYMKQMTEEVEKRCSRTWTWPHKDKFRVLMLGMGGGAMSEKISGICPAGTEVESVEYDSRVAGLAERYFGMQVSDSNKVEIADALEAVTRRLAALQETALPQADADVDQDQPPRQTTYDVVMIDCFSVGGITPEHCRNVEFLQKLAKLVEPESGVVLHHLWHDDFAHREVQTEFAQTLDLYKKDFAEVQVVPLATKVNDVVMASLPFKGAVSSSSSSSESPFGGASGAVRSGQDQV